MQPKWKRTPETFQKTDAEKTQLILLKKAVKQKLQQKFGTKRPGDKQFIVNTKKESYEPSVNN